MTKDIFDETTERIMYVIREDLQPESLEEINRSLIAATITDILRKTFGLQPMEELTEEIARAMMATTDIDNPKTADLDWRGDELWSCDFEEMAKAAIKVISNKGFIRMPKGVE